MSAPVYAPAKGSSARAPFMFGAQRSSGSLNDLAAAGSGANVVSGGGQQDAAFPSTPVPRTPLNNSQIKGLVQPVVGAMRTTTFYDIMGNSTLVVVLDINSTVAVCVAAAQETKASSFLVWQAAASDAAGFNAAQLQGQQRRASGAAGAASATGGAGRFVAILTMTNFIQILIHCHEHPDQVSQLSNMSLLQLLQMPFARVRQLEGGGIVHASPDIPLYDLLGLMIGSGINHVPVLADSTVVGAPSSSSSSPTSAPPTPVPAGGNHPTHLVGIAFLPQLLSQLVRIINNSGGAAAGSGGSPISPREPGGAATAAASGYASLFEVPLVSLPPAALPRYNCKAVDGAASWLRADQTVYEGLKRLVDAGVQALPIVDDMGRIVDTFARSDVIGLEDLGVYNLNLPIAAAVARVGHRSIPVCHADDTVGDVVAHFVATGVRTIFVVDKEEVGGSFVGQLQVADLLRFLFTATTM